LALADNKKILQELTKNLLVLLKNYFTEFMEYKRKAGMRKNTLTNYRIILEGTFDHCPVKDIDISRLHLTDIADVIQAGAIHGEWGSQRSVSVFRQLCRYLEERGERLPFNWMMIKLPHVDEKEGDYMTIEEFEDFMGKINLLSPYGLRDRALYETLWSTGVRISDALALNRDCYLNKQLKIKSIKEGNEMMIYFSDRCIQWITKYLNSRQDTCTALFVVYQLGIRRLQGCQARKNLIKYRKKFSIIKKITHHAFRRSFATNLIENGANIKEVQYLCGHKSERTTLRHYARVNKLKVGDVHRRIFDSLTQGVTTDKIKI
jgi:integrase/recombinase XerD